MDAVKYFEEKKRMLNSLGRKCKGCKGVNCSDCPLSYYNNGKELSCSVFESEYPTEAVEIVEKWAEEHPQKTILMDFLEKYPKARLDKNGMPYNICPYELGIDEEKKCSKSCIDCWNRPIE